jgi:hypothetical protein
MRFRAKYLRLQMHTDSVILIVFPLQQWLHVRASMSRCTYIVCLLYVNVMVKQEYPVAKMVLMLVVNIISYSICRYSLVEYYVNIISDWFLL